MSYLDSEETRRIRETVLETLESPLGLGARFRGWVPRFIEQETDLTARVTALESQFGWTAYTPTLTAATTNPTLGTGGGFCQNGRWVRGTDRTIHAYIDLCFGTSGATDGAGSYSISLPVASTTVNISRQNAFGSGWIYDNSGTDFRLVTVLHGANTSAVSMMVEGAGVVTDTSPWTWAANDQIHLSITYEGAS